MGLVPDDIDTANMTPDQVAAEIDKVKLTKDQRLEYAEKFVDVIIDDKDLFELVPPKILADAYVATKERIAESRGDARDAALNRFAVIASRIDYLSNDFANQMGYFYADPSNIADVYAGYKKMFEVRAVDLAPSEKNNAATAKYNADKLAQMQDNSHRLEQFIA